jgi:hypothetical protein
MDRQHIRRNHPVEAQPKEGRDSEQSGLAAYQQETQHREELA